MKSYLGELILEVFIERTTEYKNEADATKKQQMKDEAMDKWMAYLFTTGSDNSKYGMLTKSFQSQFSLGHNQYPKI